MGEREREGWRDGWMEGWMDGWMNWPIDQGKPARVALSGEEGGGGISWGRRAEFPHPFVSFFFSCLSLPHPSFDEDAKRGVCA